MTQLQTPTIVGAAMTPVSRKLDGTALEVAARVFHAACRDAGIPPTEVDGLFVTPPRMAGPPSFMWACQLGMYLGIEGKNLAMLECGGTTAFITLKFALDEVMLGRGRRVAVICVDERFDIEMDEMHTFLKNTIATQINLYGLYEGMLGVGAPIPFYAMGAQRYLYEHNLKVSDLAPVCVQLREHAAHNEYAQFRDPTTVEEVLAAKMVCPPLTLPMCSSFASSAACVILAPEEEAKSLRRPYARFKSVGEWHEPESFAPRRGTMSSYPTAAKASSIAYQEAGVNASDMDVAELYGVFAATELMLYEDFGFAGYGKAANYVADGGGKLGGKGVLINPSGGRLSLGHPAGVTPMMETIELFWHLTDQAGSRQKKDARLGVAHAEHGMLNGSTVMIWERPS